MTPTRSTSLTTLRQDTAELGRQMGEKLISLIENPKTTLVETIVVEGHVFEGNSVADINEKGEQHAVTDHI